MNLVGCVNNSKNGIYKFVVINCWNIIKNDGFIVVLILFNINL